MFVDGRKQTLNGQITKITAGIDETVRDEFGVLVDVALPQLSDAEARALLTPGSPATLKARRPMPWDGLF